jgi:hypothetical protein
MVGLMGQAKSRAVSPGNTYKMTKAPSRNGMITNASRRVEIRTRFSPLDNTLASSLKRCDRRH